MTSEAKIRRLRGPLLRWYRRVRRDLPWRRTRDPYAIWVSEVMLQQTQVTTVLPYYARFLERFPDPAALAAADEEEVLAAWSGLGYYRRARALHAGARVVMERHGGRLPEEPEALRALPGIGRYTSGAIASIAFNRAEPLLDGNVRRVLARLFAVDAAALGRREEERRLWSIAATLVRGRDPGDLNQAVMELGATICSPRRPDCSACPLRASCRARGLSEIERYPAATPRVPTVSVRVGVALVRRGSSCLLERPQGRSPLRGRWDLPAVELEPGGFAVQAIEGALAERYGLEVRAGRLLHAADHGILHRRLRLEVHAVRFVSGAVAGREALRWVRLDRLDEAAISGATRKALRAQPLASASASRSPSSVSGGIEAPKR